LYTDQALHSVIPKTLAEKLVKGENVEPELWENATIFQTDLIGFTGMASEKTPVEVQPSKKFLNDVFNLKIILNISPLFYFRQ
jgi:hypothetical protein